jgi:hemolysin activation/secretion protein
VSFPVDRIEVVGNTVLQREIAALVQPLEGQTLTLDQLLDLRTAITELYLNQGYITSGAFLPTGQDLTRGVVQIQVVEGEVEAIQINGLGRLPQGYIQARLAQAIQPPLRQQRLEEALRLLQINPLLARVSAELTAGTRPGQNLLILDVVEADATELALTLDNTGSVSTGSLQGEVRASHGNLLGFGDFARARYDHTRGLNLYELTYGIPLNARDGTLQLRYENASSRIVTPEFADLGIRNQSQTTSLYWRQPLSRSLAQEWALGLAFDLRESRSFILDDIPFSFSEGVEEGVARVSALRFSQEWLGRGPRRVLAARSQFSLGLDMLGATSNDTGTDGRFLAWLGQFQWVEQLGSRWLLVSRLNTQLTPDSLLPLERFSLGGAETVRGYSENQLVTDNAVTAGLELRIPLAAQAEQLQVIPFIEGGTGWNNRTPAPTPSTLLGLGVGLQWQPSRLASLRLDYGIPLIGVPNRGNSLQESGIYFSLTVRPF